MWVGPAAANAATLPPELVALEQQMAGLTITSLRFSARTSIALPPAARKLGKLLKIFGAGSRESGEVTVTPPAANVTGALFGTPLTLRVVGTKTFVYIRKLGAVDHGRPWLELGAGGLAELISHNGKPLSTNGEPMLKIGEPPLAEPPFAELTKLLAGAREVHEIGPETVDGQPVVSFLATLEPAQFEHEQAASVAARTSSVPPNVTLEVSLAADGLPVRTVITVQSITAPKDQITTTSVLEIPAINFPLVIEAPPADQTITVEQRRALERRERAKHRRSHK
jgi:hypothetical protein